MSTIVTRAGKGSALSHSEMDANLTNLNNDKAETSSLGTAASKNVGTTVGTVAAGDHLHTGVYEPADATILKDADIGVTVASQSHLHTGVYEPADATILKSAAIGTTVQPYDANTAKLNVAQQFTAIQRSKTAVPISNSCTVDLSTGQDFAISGLTGAKTLSFTNATAGQHGCIWFNNPSGYTIAEGPNIYNESNFFTGISAPGYYVISYWVYGASAIMVTATGNMA